MSVLHKERALHSWVQASLRKCLRLVLSRKKIVGKSSCAQKDFHWHIWSFNVSNILSFPPQIRTISWSSSRTLQTEDELLLYSLFTLSVSHISTTKCFSFTSKELVLLKLFMRLRIWKGWTPRQAITLQPNAFSPYVKAFQLCLFSR